MLKPRAGKLLVKRIETEDTLPEGKVLLLDDTKNKMTSGQFEIVAVGDDLVCENEDCERQHYWKYKAGIGRTHGAPPKVGAWVLLAPRSLIATDDPIIFLVAQDGVLALLSE
jgi:hypothetical protein